jgi:hypothetical protein
VLDPFLLRWRLAAPNLDEEIIPFELLLPNPKPRKRWHDDVDLAARSLFACPVCGARRGIVCAWAELRAIPSWCAHTARRVLVDEKIPEHARKLRIFGALAP